MHVPLRRCRICRTVKPKKDLTRWVYQNSQLLRDDNQIIQARAVYTCSQTCTDKLMSKKERAKR